MLYPVKPIPFKPPRLVGISEPLINQHYETLYGGLVQQINAGGNNSSDKPGAPAPNLVGRLNAAVLHEVFFDILGGADGLGGPAGPAHGALADLISQHFGSVEQWQQRWLDHAASNSGGWIVLGFDARQRVLVDLTLGTGDSFPIHWHPLISVCLDDAALQPDFTNRCSDYLAAVFGNLCWQRLDQQLARTRYAIDEEISADADNLVNAESLHVLLDGNSLDGNNLNGKNSPVLLDVCLPEDRSKRYDRLPGATMISPDELPEWISTLDRRHPVVVYCMYGCQVSGNATDHLRDAGIEAQRLAGGIAAWHAMGGPTEALK